MIAASEGDALVTGPISKRNLAAAQHYFLGHTEMLEELARRNFIATNAKAEMLFVYKNSRLLLLTRHIPLREVSRVLSQRENVERPIGVADWFLRQRLGIDKPRPSPCSALIRMLAKSAATRKKMSSHRSCATSTNPASPFCDGPFGADGFFRDFDPLQDRYDTIVAGYHDQGLIPFKLMAVA